MKDGTIRVSYIISTRNRAKFLAETMHNVREFITPEDELLIIDGGSTDNTAEVVAANRDIVTLFMSEPDKGEAHGFNKGILASRGQFLKLLTDDDYTYPATMIAAIKEMQADQSIDVLLCGGEHYKVNPDGELELDFYFRLSGDRAKRVGRSVQETGDTAGPGLALLLRRRVLPLVGLLNTSFLCTDTEFLARLKRPEVTLRYYDAKLYRHIDHPHSGVLNRKRAMRDAVLTFIASGAWPRATHYDSEAIADALALTSHSGGSQMARVLRNIEYLRQTEYGPALMHLSAWASTVVVNLFRLVRRIKHIGRKQCTATIELGWAKVEPDWFHRVL